MRDECRRMKDGLPDNLPLPVDAREPLPMNQALREAMADVEANRILSSAEFMAKAQERWPR